MFTLHLPPIQIFLNSCCWLECNNPDPNKYQWEGPVCFCSSHTASCERARIRKTIARLLGRAFSLSSLWLAGFVSQVTSWEKKKNTDTVSINFRDVRSTGSVNMYDTKVFFLFFYFFVKQIIKMDFKMTFKNGQSEGFSSVGPATEKVSPPLSVSVPPQAADKLTWGTRQGHR